jgi:hypothetical protein
MVSRFESALLVGIVAMTLVSCASGAKKSQPRVVVGVQSIDHATANAGAVRFTSTGGGSRDEGTYDFAKRIGEGRRWYGDGTSGPFRVIGDAAYVSLSPHMRGPTNIGPKCTAASRWMRFDFAGSFDNATKLTSSDIDSFISPSPLGTDHPLGMLVELDSSIARAGTDVLHGVSTTRYDVALDVGALNARGPEALRVLPGFKPHLVIWVDHELRLRKLKWSVDSSLPGLTTSTKTVEFLSYGERLNVSEPKGGEVCDFDREAQRAP